MAVLQLQKGSIYGPVASRRLGRSLGINLLPWDRKICTFDCCYCQYGRTRNPGSMAGKLPSVQRVVEAVEGALGEFRILDAITFSGNGEPTMHPDFASIVREVRRLRDRLMPSVPIAILSNSSLCTDENVRAAISDVDLRIMKLEVGSQRMLEKMNRPGAKVTFEGLVSALTDMPGTIIQALFVKGSVDNRDDAALQDWVSTLARVRPIEVQIYSLDRPAPDKGLEAVGIDRLESIAELVRSKLGIKAKAYGR